MKILTAILSLFFLNSLKAQEKLNDTLFFKYDQKYINTYKEMPGHFYLYDSGGGNNGSFFFTEREVKSNLNPKKILSLKKFVRSSDCYKKKKLKDEKLAAFFSKYIVFLVKNVDNKEEFIQVESSFEIE